MIRAILFDAVGTLFRSEPPVAEVYHRAGRQMGSQISLEDVAQRFDLAIKKHHQTGPTSEAGERERWGRIVYDIFDDVADPEQHLLDELWRHFGAAESWRLFEDVAPVWQELSARGYLLGIASNFDGRLRGICRSHPPLDQCQQIFVSSEIGFPKPAAEFYRLVQQQVDVPAESILLVGDDFVPDVTAPREAGWNSIWLRRKEPQTSPEWIRSLADLLHSNVLTPAGRY